MSKAFTLIEVLVVIGIITILLGLAIIFYHQYLSKAIKASLLSDVRNCLSLVAISKQENGTSSLSQVVATCPKSKYTQNLILESENPIKLTATSISGEVACSYNETSKKVWSVFFRGCFSFLDFNGIFVCYFLNVVCC